MNRVDTFPPVGEVNPSRPDPDPLTDPVVAAMDARMRRAGWPGPMNRDGTYPTQTPTPSGTLGVVA